VLLNNVRRYQIPIILLDLKNPVSLSAVDIVGGIPLLKNLVDRGLIILPDVVTGSPSYAIFPAMLPKWAVSQATQDSRNVAQNFGLPASRLLYTPKFMDNLPTSYPIIFTSMIDGFTSRWKNSRLIRIPINNPIQAATADGLAIELRRKLLTNALISTNDPGDNRLLVLGESLPDSAFGDPQTSQATLLYIAAHPWIRVLGAADFFTLHQNLILDVPFDETRIVAYEPELQFSTLLADLARPDQNNILNNAAWQAALALYAPLPPESPELVELRGVYSGQIGILLTAAAWAKSPRSLQECTVDLDLDGRSECLYATPNSLAIFDPLGGRLLALFHISENQIHQIIGPTYQFLIGQADPSSWDLSAGEAADPGVIPGAFNDGLPPWDLYQPEFSSDKLTLRAPQDELVKTFTLNENGLIVDYKINSPLSINVPLVLDPWLRFFSGWGDRYRYEQSEDGLNWKIIDGPQLTVRSSTPASLEPFTASLTKLRQPEDPNFAYPPGHYLAFPVALVRIDARDDFQVKIAFSTNESGH
jgi:hypothetical protein